MQKVYSGVPAPEALKKILTGLWDPGLFVVCGKTCGKLAVMKDIRALFPDAVWFDDFAPNPTYDSVCEGVEKFRESGCRAILAVGGGSAMDVAKCIKLYSSMDPTENYLKQEPSDNGVELIAIPTTAGTGSEATRFAVIYYKGEKQSVNHLSLIPGHVILVPELLKTLPVYQKKATMLDAFCHALESWWSVNSTEESRACSEQAVEMAVSNMDAYLANTEEGNDRMLMAANLAGKAINLTQTTAAHAMCYKITSLCGLAHGHSAALCLPKIWRYMLEHPEDCIDPRGSEYLMDVFARMAKALGASGAEEGPEAFEKILKGLEMEVPSVDESCLQKMVDSVNPVRLKNNPVRLDRDVLEMLYRQILHVK